MVSKIAKQVLKIFAPQLDEKIENMRSRIKREVTEYIFRKSKRMKALFDYVNEPNKLDIEVKKLKGVIKKLKKDSHPPIFSKKERNKILKRLDKIESE